MNNVTVVNNNNSINNNSEYNMSNSIEQVPVFDYSEEFSQDEDSINQEGDRMSKITMENGRTFTIQQEGTMDDGTVVEYTTEKVVMFNREMVRETSITDAQAVFAFNMIRKGEDSYFQDSIVGRVVSIISSQVSHEQAIASGIFISRNMDVIISNGSYFQSKFIQEVSNTTVGPVTVGVDGAEIAYQAVIDAGIVSNDDGVVVIGESMMKMVKRSVTKRFPMDMSKGNPVGSQRVRVKGYSKVNHGWRAANAIHAVEQSQYTISDVMVSIAEQVMEGQEDKYQKAVKIAMKPVAYVIAGSRMMDSSKAYTSEFSFDDRGRIYQVDRFGPSGQASDMERAMMDFANVSSVRPEDVEQAIVDMKVEMWDMVGKISNDQFDMARKMAVANPVAFIRKNVANIKGNSMIKKPWNFTKFAMIVAAFERGESPYVGVAIGYDAKCSGPQMMAQMTNSKVMMNRTGVSTTAVQEDAYEAAAREVEAAMGIVFSRSAIKKPFMSVFYGAGYMAMTEKETVEEAAHVIMFGVTNEDWSPSEEDIQVAKQFRATIINSFTAPIKRMKNKMAASGYDYKAGESKYEVAPKVVMADGFEMAMSYITSVNMDGEVIGNYNEDGIRTEATDVVVQFEGQSIVIEKASFSTGEIDGSAHARNSFVNFTQASDAVMARAISQFTVVHGMEHFVAIHDAFRANIHEVAVMRRVIADANIAVFGVNQASEYTDVQKRIIDVESIDMIGNFFQSAVDSVKYQYKGIAEAAMESQFYANGFRINNNSVQIVNGNQIKESMKSVFESFVTEGGATAEYFGK